MSAPQMECPECGEDAVNEPATDHVPWEAHENLPEYPLPRLPQGGRQAKTRQPQWSHWDGSSLCPVIGPSGGYEPAQPRQRAPEPGSDVTRPEPPATMRRAERREPAQGSEKMFLTGDQRQLVAVELGERAPGDQGNPYQPFTPEHAVWEIAQITPDMPDEDVIVHAGWVPHDGTLLREDLIAQYRRESAGSRERAERGDSDCGYLDEIDPRPGDRQLRDRAAAREQEAGS